MTNMAPPRRAVSVRISTGNKEGKKRMTFKKGTLNWNRRWALLATIAVLAALVALPRPVAAADEETRGQSRLLDRAIRR